MGMIEVFACLYLLTMLLLLEDKERKKERSLLWKLSSPKFSQSKYVVYKFYLFFQTLHESCYCVSNETPFILHSYYHSSIPCHSLGKLF